MSKKRKDIRPVDVNKIDLDELKKKTVDLPGLIEFAHSVGGFAITPTKQGHIKGKAMTAMQQQTQQQLDLLFEQMKALATQAKIIRDRVDVSQWVYDAAMNFQPDIGQRYFLYQKTKAGDHVLSLIGPDEWKNNMRFEACIAEVELLADHTWKIHRRFDQDEE